MENKIGDNIKKCRQMAGIKQGDFAKILGITSTTLSRIERGKGSIKMDTLKKISEKLEIPLEKIIFGVDTILLNSEIIEKLRSKKIY